MNIFLTLILFYIGASIGSFLSVVIHRHKHNKKGTLFGKSMCPKCGAALTALDLIPIFSFTALRGKCRHCKKQISPHYVFIELVTGLVFAFMYWKIQFISFGDVAPYLTFSWVEFWIYLYASAAGVLLTGIFFYDLLYKEIPDIFTYPGIALAVGGAIVARTLNFPAPEILFPTLREIFYGLLIAFAIFEGQRFLSKGKWIGLGDSILAYFMAILLGWKFLLVAIFAAYFIGTIFGLILIAGRKATLRSAVPFGPFLVTGTFLAIFFGNALISFYANYAAI